MTRIAFIFGSLASALPTSALAGNFATCILDKMPDVQSDAAAGVVRQLCLEKFPKGLRDVEVGSGNGWIFKTTPLECAAEKAAKSGSRAAVLLIHQACRTLFGEPVIIPSWPATQEPKSHQQAPAAPPQPAVPPAPVTADPAPTQRQTYDWRQEDIQRATKRVLRRYPHLGENGGHNKWMDAVIAWRDAYQTYMREPADVAVTMAADRVEDLRMSGFGACHPDTSSEFSVRNGDRGRCY